MNSVNHPRVKPPTASPAPSISLSSPSALLIPTADRCTGRKIGLANPIDALKVGLDVILTGLGKEEGYEPVMVGDDAAELTVEPGIDIGMAMGSLGFGRVLIGEPIDAWESRR